MTQPVALQFQTPNPTPRPLARFSPLDYPCALQEPLHLCPTEWAGHIPFAMAVVEMCQPRILVELGTQGGVSYCAFCQAIDRLQLNCRAYAVDTWEGDAHTRAYGSDVLQNLRNHHDILYSRFSRLIRETFDEAIQHFEDGIIDLLHIDGYHTYEAVQHDFDTWLPKMSPSGVILFHDINVREKDFGAWKHWNNIREQYPSFEFHHQHGLGVLAVGSQCPQPILELCGSSPQEAQLVREFYAHLGQRSFLRLQNRALQRERDTEKSRAEVFEKELEAMRLSVNLLNEQLAHYDEVFGCVSRNLVKRQMHIFADLIAPRGSKRREWIKRQFRRNG